MPDYWSYRKSYRQKIPDPTPEKIEEFASYGLSRKLMAVRLGMTVKMLNDRIFKNSALQEAELRGKLKRYE